MSNNIDIIASRKLTESETATLRSILKSQLNIKAGDAQDEEDAGDLLDYAFAMIANGRSVGCVTDEVSVLHVCMLLVEYSLFIHHNMTQYIYIN